MPRGVPRAGFRMTKNRMSSDVKIFKPAYQVPTVALKQETEQEVYDKLKTRFDAMEVMAEATALGKIVP